MRDSQHLKAPATNNDFLWTISEFLWTSFFFSFSFFLLKVKVWERYSLWKDKKSTLSLFIMFAANRFYLLISFINDNKEPITNLTTYKINVEGGGKGKCWPGNLQSSRFLLLFSPQPGGHCIFSTLISSNAKLWL